MRGCSTAAPPYGQIMPEAWRQREEARRCIMSSAPPGLFPDRQSRCRVSLRNQILSATYTIESVQFGAFCIFEAAIGAVFPLIALLKSQHIDDADRNLVYSMFRLPLNVLVLLVHSLDREGDEHRIAVFMAVARTLLTASTIGLDVLGTSYMFHQVKTRPGPSSLKRRC
ncbi:hypothetical protein G6O67_001925 [Ophiocordyceps sinensis]|uniref:Uncharacterized protein n=1 Tax=Ophiocordyceps sinensis TaxID=72228 RepID=A0A8H4PT31_9HYPO|nr:hypothetical protein G6O67_001925 [Ophiocordyceps sinensis]